MLWQSLVFATARFGSWRSAASSQERQRLGDAGLSI
jgi:hypothetical protein